MDRSMKQLAMGIHAAEDGLLTLGWVLTDIDTGGADAHETGQLGLCSHACHHSRQRFLEVLALAGCVVCHDAKDTAAKVSQVPGVPDLNSLSVPLHDINDFVLGDDLVSLYRTLFGRNPENPCTALGIAWMVYRCHKHIQSLTQRMTR
jgi:hypothetical protein